MLREALGDTRRGLFLADGTRGKRVIGDDAASAVQDVGAGRMALLIGQGKPSQPIVEGNFSAIKCGNVMIFGQLFDGGERFESAWRIALRTVGHFVDSRSSATGSEKSRANSGLIRAGWSRAVTKARHCLAETANSRLSARACSAWRQALSIMKSVMLAPVSCAPVRINDS